MVPFTIAVKLLQSGLANQTSAVEDMLVNATEAVIVLGGQRGLGRYLRFYRTRLVPDFEVMVQL